MSFFKKLILKIENTHFSIFNQIWLHSVWFVQKSLRKNSCVNWGWIPGFNHSEKNVVVKNPKIWVFSPFLKYNQNNFRERPGFAGSLPSARVTHALLNVTHDADSADSPDLCPLPQGRRKCRKHEHWHWLALGKGRVQKGWVCYGPWNNAVSLITICTYKTYSWLSYFT